MIKDRALITASAAVTYKSNFLFPHNTANPQAAMDWFMQSSINSQDAEEGESEVFTDVPNIAGDPMSDFEEMDTEITNLINKLDPEDALVPDSSFETLTGDIKRAISSPPEDRQPSPPLPPLPITSSARTVSRKKIPRTKTDPLHELLARQHKEQCELLKILIARTEQLTTIEASLRRR